MAVLTISKINQGVKEMHFAASVANADAKLFCNHHVAVDRLMQEKKAEKAAKVKKKLAKAMERLVKKTAAKKAKPAKSADALEKLKAVKCLLNYRRLYQASNKLNAFLYPEKKSRERYTASLRESLKNSPLSGLVPEDMLEVSFFEQKESKEEAALLDSRWPIGPIFGEWLDSLKTREKTTLSDEIQKTFQSVEDPSSPLQIVTALLNNEVVKAMFELSVLWVIVAPENKYSVKEYGAKKKIRILVKSAMAQIFSRSKKAVLHEDVVTSVAKAIEKILLAVVTVDIAGIFRTEFTKPLVTQLTGLKEVPAAETSAEEAPEVPEVMATPVSIDIGIDSVKVEAAKDAAEPAPMGAMEYALRNPSRGQKKKAPRP